MRNLKVPSAELLLLLTIVIASLGARATAATRCSCTSPRLDYSATGLPQQSTPAWNSSITPGAILSTAGGSLQLNTISGVQEAAFFNRAWAANNAQGFTVEAGVRLDEYTGDTNLGGTAIWVEDDKNAEVLLIRPEGIRLYASGLSYNMNTMDRHHTYRITASGQDIQVFVDGNLAIDGTGVFGTTSWTARNMIAFGDGSSGASSKSSWTYVRYYNCLWEAHYSGDELPQLSSPSWSPMLSGNHQLSTSGGSLTTNTLCSVDTVSYFVRNWGARSTQATSVESRMKLDDYVGDINLGGAAIWIGTDTKTEVLLIRPGGLRLYRAGLMYSMNTTVGFHTYCIDTSNNDIFVYVDGRLAIDGRGTFSALSGTQYNWVGFGDGSGGASSKAQWDFFQYTRR